MAARYRKRPVEIEAMQWDGTAAGAEPVINWVLAHGGNANYRCRDAEPCAEAGQATGPHDIQVRTLEGPMLAGPGWWVVRGVQGEFYPVRDDIFAATYDPVE